MDFNEAFDRVMGHEGGYVNHPNDPGGETNWGITARTARAYGYEGEMRQLTREQARDIYHKGYWQRARADRLPGPLAFQLFDAAVNHGVGNAIRMLQRAVDELDDGLVGSRTLTAVKRRPVNEVLLRFAAERLEFYTRLTRFDTFGRGWVRRVAGNLRYAVEDAA